MAPLCVATLGAIDLARATSAKVQLQDALDAAALGAARSTATSDAELQVVGDRFLRQNLALSAEFRLTSSSFTFTDDNKVRASAGLQVTPYVAGLINDGIMDISTSAEVVRASVRLEIALVLDNTTSMLEGDKFPNLKVAAKNFVDKMRDAADQSDEPDAVKISLVPFSHTVRVDGPTYRHAAWLDQTGVSPINNQIFTTAGGVQFANRFTLFDTIGTAWRGCLEMRQAPYDVQDTPPTTGATLFTPYFAVDEPDSRTSGYSDNYQNDYIDDRTSSSNWRVRQGSVSKYRNTSGMSTSHGPNRGCGIRALMRLTTNYAGLRSAIDNLVADGSTNIPMGLMWGWHTLSPNAPFADGVPYDTPKLKKVVVLMTDGENTIPRRDTPNESSYAGIGYIWQGRVLTSGGAPLQTGAFDAQRTAALDHRLSLVCQNMKAKGIEVYTIRVEVESGDSSVLENCASSPNHYYNVEDADDMNMVFQSIAGQIAALHLSR